LLRILGVQNATISLELVSVSSRRASLQMLRTRTGPIALFSRSSAMLGRVDPKVSRQTFKGDAVA